MINKMWYEPVTYLIILGLVYYLFMMINRASYMQAKPEGKSDIINPATNPNFARDTLYKYLTAWVMGVLFIFELVEFMKAGISRYEIKGDKNAEQVCTYLDKLFCSVVLPIELIIEACIVKRRRCPSLSCDLLIIFGFLIAIFVVRFIFQQTSRTVKNFFLDFASTFLQLIFSFDGYIFFDWLLHKSNATGGNYALFTA